MEGPIHEGAPGSGPGKIENIAKFKEAPDR